MNAPELFKNFEALGVVTPGTPVRVGQTYLVMCAMLREIGRKEAVPAPIVPFLHADSELGVDMEHYHYDGRFRQPRFTGVNPTNRRATGIPSPFFHLFHFSKYQLVGLELRAMKCVSTQSGLPLREMVPSALSIWYRKMEGKRCAGKRCPHYGTPMVERDGGLLECPLHGLFADKKTQRIIARSEALARIKPKI